MKRLIATILLASSALTPACPVILGQTPPGGPEKKFRDFGEVIRTPFQKHEGFVTLYHKDDHLFAEISPFQFDQPMLAPITIAKGLAMAGQPLNFGDEW